MSSILLPTNFFYRILAVVALQYSGVGVYAMWYDREIC